MQKIADIRIDERLIHGQVSVMWLNTLKANRIMVVDDDVIKDEFHKKMLKLACPSSAKLSVLSVATAVTNLNNEKYDGDTILIIVKEPKTVLEMIESGLKVTEVNIGFMGVRENTLPLSKQAYFSIDQLFELQKMMDYGVSFTARPTPDDRGFDVKAAVQKLIDTFQSK